jgi:hypothetical protein
MRHEGGEVKIMFRTTAVCLFIVIIGLFSSSMRATIFDNRYIPFLQRPYIVVPEKRSHVTFDMFFATASQAFGLNDTEVSIPALSGVYNQNAVAKSFVTLGCKNPLPSRYQDRNIIWSSTGKILAQGLEVSLRKRLASDYYWGFYWYFMRVNTASIFYLNLTESGLAGIPQADALLLDRKRREMNARAGLVTGDHAAQIGLGDLDAYIAWERAWDYVLKFRSIRAEASFGGLFPVGQTRDIYKPTSIPFGGDGFWGAYVAAQVEFELKEDWKAGVFGRVSKRFARTKLERIPLHCEPVQFAPLIAPIDINPGATAVFMAWAGFEDVHKGLGARLLLTVRKHWQDQWKNRSNQNCNCINLCNLEELTEWGSDYITLNVFYDFGKIKTCHKHDPIIFFAWDIPSNQLATWNVVKTNKVMLGIELSF